MHEPENAVEYYNKYLKKNIFKRAEEGVGGIQRVENRYCINCETYGHMANSTLAALNPPKHVKEQAQILTLTPIQLIALLGREYHMLKPPTLPALKKHNRWRHVPREILLSQ
ncbi:hypothetical protein TNCV_3533551 [Trichonephila clavipes]|nr:hypothetical protein TNCV_3533551 [Trichonephila clavipes]